MWCDGCCLTRSEGWGNGHAEAFAQEDRNIGPDPAINVPSRKSKIESRK